MKTVGFIGGYDKVDLLLYIARILTLAEKRVILIDGTQLQKTRYIIPAINPTAVYITEFEGFDVAVGFKNIEGIESYLGRKIDLDYDIALLDIDTYEVAEKFNIEENDKNCFVTGFDIYSIKRGIEILQVLKKPSKMYKVLFSNNLFKEENEYLDYLSYNTKVAWDQSIINFPIELVNYSVGIQNQTIARIRMKKLSDHYKESILYLLSLIFEEDIAQGEAKKIIKSLERI